MPSPRSKRNPGWLPKLRQKIDAKDDRKSLRQITSQADELLGKMWGKAANSLPGKHAKTHKGGNDSLSNRGLPSAIVPGAVGERGNPRGGFATWNHVHDATELSIPTPANIPTDPPFANLQDELNFLLSVLLRTRGTNDVFAATHFF